jgi:UPF0716 protein FxsA
LVFVVGPIVELAVMFEVAQAVGFFPMLFLLIAFSVAGFMLTKRVGLGVMQRLQARAEEAQALAASGSGSAAAAAALPPGAAVDGALIGLAGVLVVVPGFVTGIIGFLLFIPPLRRLAGKLAGRWLKGRVDAQFTVVGPAGPRRTRAASAPRPGGSEPFGSPRAPGTQPAGDASDPRTGPRDPGTIRRLPPGDVA